MFIKRNEEYGDAFKSYLKYGYGGLDSKERRSLSTDQATKGGAFISETFSDVFYSALAGNNRLREFCKVIKSPNKIKFPYTTANPAIELVAESGASDNSWSAVQPTSTYHETAGFNIGCRVDASIEMVMDYPDIESYLAESAGMALATKEENYCFNGTGSGQPKGITVETVANTTSSSAVDMDQVLQSMAVDGFTDYNNPRDLIIFINPLSLAKNAIATNGTDETTKVDPSNTYDAYISYLRAIGTSQLGKSGVVGQFWACVGNWKRAFVIFDIGETVIKRDTESQAADGIVNFYVTKRFDCKLVNANAITLCKRS